MTSKISLTPEQEANINELVEEHYRDVPLFYEDGICEVLFVPVEGAELRVLHHKPKNPVTQRPVLFASGFGTSPWSWRHFNTPMYEKGEYYFLETREKSTSKILTKRRKTNLTIDQHAKDLAIVIEHLGLTKRDFILFGTSFTGGVMITGLANDYFTAPTIVVHDPLVDWKVQKRL
ncbi:MAG: alpha/beta fold hydrolase, partial [Candidatus Heimdallarchaeota archaeon]